jgi:hypothetical protein
MRRRITRRRDGVPGCTLRLSSAERALLANLPLELEQVLAAMATALDIGATPAPADDDESPADGGTGPERGAAAELPPSLRRLFPTAYARDEEAEAGFVAMARAELLEHHRQSLRTLAATAEATILSDEETQGWLAALNDLRLVLGTVLDVRDTEPEVMQEPMTNQMAVYHYLSALEGELIEYLSISLPEPTPGADDQIPDDPWGEPLGGLRWDGTPQPPEWP